MPRNKEVTSKKSAQTEFTAHQRPAPPKRQDQARFTAIHSKDPDQVLQNLQADLQSGRYTVALHSNARDGREMKGRIYLVVEAGGSEDIFKPDVSYQVTIQDRRLER